MMDNLVAQGRYLQETFTPLVPTLAETIPSYNVSEIALHNNEDQGYWLIIDDAVYDVTPFRNQHPGGFKILRSYAGMDATIAYHKVGHHADQEIQAMLTHYRIGLVKPFSHQQISALIDNCYCSWIKYLFLIVEIQNALSNDFSIQGEIATQDEVKNGICVSPVKLMMYIKTHQRFVLEFLPQIFGQLWEYIWQTTGEMYQEDLTELSEVIPQLQETEIMQNVLDVYSNFITKLKIAVANDTINNSPVMINLHKFCTHLEQLDSDLLEQLKLIVCKIVQLWEEYGYDAMSLEAKTKIRQIALQFPDTMRYYYHQVASSEILTLGSL